jgi:hypothetical protein
VAAAVAGSAGAGACAAARHGSKAAAKPSKQRSRHWRIRRAAGNGEESGEDSKFVTPILLLAHGRSRPTAEAHKHRGAGRACVYQTPEEI